MAAIWVGGLIYTAAVAVPFAVKHEADERQRILRGLARRFRWIGWGAIVVLILTGIGNLLLRLSPISLRQLFNGEAFDPRVVDRFIAIWLPWKLMLVFVMIGLMLYHDITSIRAARRYEGAADRAPGNRGGSFAAALATLVAIAVLYVSVRLVRG
ncbi:MAG TPA: CopD family protein [Blastocatellia bacterium]|nr:CopD family protein [Blastocatellia bacterium]